MTATNQSRPPRSPRPDRRGHRDLRGTTKRCVHQTPTLRDHAALTTPLSMIMPETVPKCSRPSAMRLSARVDYALRAVIELAATQREAATTGAGHYANYPTTAERLAAAQQSQPSSWRASCRNSNEHTSSPPNVEPSEATGWPGRRRRSPLADVIRGIDRPLAHVRGSRPEDLGHVGAARPLQNVWIALRIAHQRTRDSRTSRAAEITASTLPDRVQQLAARPDA